jgi:hypothetical protein
MFVNAFGLGEYIAAAVDDNADKNGLFPPGFRVGISRSDDLVNSRIQTCLLAINPQSAIKSREKLSPLEARGVKFHSIYAGVEGSILSGVSPWL